MGNAMLPSKVPLKIVKAIPTVVRGSIWLVSSASDR